MGAVMAHSGKCLARMAESPFAIQNDRMVTLETPRLILRRWREEDVAPMTAVNADPEVMRWIRDGSVRDEQQTRDGIQAWEIEWESQGFGLFAVEIRSTGELAGFTGLSVPEFLPEILPAVEVGWRLGRSHWGQGLATEAAAAAVRFAFEERGLERIVSIAQVGNDASERIMTKLGMHPVRETVNPTCGRRVRVFELSSDQYVATTRNPEGHGAR
ncbi:N-acetyltransferase [Streptomyces hiroshimensis]|uniref:N-acetyltransferase n=2 Tax=Streptomyces hiroshimensis TaxID=66424 RepID=A0ABQ2Y8H1_9ACTN|nr:N-acetyltransferase [Streptomyces hiroshimensis]